MISIYYGTRPEYIKVKLLYDRLVQAGLDVELVKVLQHTDLIKGCHSDRNVHLDSDKSNRLNDVVSSCLGENILSPNTDMVIVQGDTATAFGVALNAFHRKILIAHVEAGLRTFDVENPYPEESYRRCISAFSTYHFCVTDHNLDNLMREGIAKDRIYVVGNTSLDNICGIQAEYGNTVLVTLHRRENREIMAQWFDALEKAAIENPDLKFVLPLHPSLNSENIKIKSVKITKPMPHDELIRILSECRFAVTDSGGIQEEASFLNKKTIVCRKKTERVEGLGVFSFLCEDPCFLPNMIHTVASDYKVEGVCPYGDGTATQKIAEIIEDIYHEAIQTRT